MLLVKYPLTAPLVIDTLEESDLFQVAAALSFSCEVLFWNCRM